MDSVLRPAADWELGSFLSEATARGSPVEIVGGQSKAQFGHRGPPAATISTDVMRSIRSYDPAERIVTVQAGCLVSELEHELSAKGQRLGFEPVDIASVFGNEPGRSTIGGVIASNLAGSRRIAGAGIGSSVVALRAVAGSGDVITSGTKTTRGASGLDLTRIIAGSWGTLAAIVEVSLRVQWIAGDTRTIVILGLSEEIAIEALSDALLTSCGVTGAVHLEPPIAKRLSLDALQSQGLSVTALRLENTLAAAPGQIDRLRNALQAYGEMHELGADHTSALWNELRLLSVLSYSETPLWRISTRPSKAFEVVSAIRRYMSVDAFYDWSGGLIWMEVPNSADAGATEIRRVVASAGGHATLVRASEDVKASVEVFEPMHPGIEFLSKRLKKVFDPAGILNPGRLYADM